MVRMHEVRQKEVINAKDGCRFGYVSDIVLDLKDGKIGKLIIAGPGKMFGIFGREQEYQVPWDKVKKIGDDIILVDIDAEKCLVDTDY